jgi:hypothetical protein
MSQDDQASYDQAARRGAWSAAEDSQLLDAVERHGTRSWTKIAAHTPGRSAKVGVGTQLHDSHASRGPHPWSAEC